MMECQTMIQTQEEDSIPASPFYPIHDEARSSETPEISHTLERLIDGSEILIQGFDDHIIGSKGQKACVLVFDQEIIFNFSLKDRKIWFSKRQNGDTEAFISQTETQLESLVCYLQTKCPQQNFFECYDLLEQKSKGKNSHVWTARRKIDQKIFAVKIQKYTSGFREQIKILRVLKHPNIIHFQQYFISHQNDTYIVMDYEDGGSLLDVIHTEQKLSPREKIKIITDMLNALQFLRIKGIIHRDLKPQNILYNTKDGNYKIADFGISKKVGEKLDKISGTPGYIAPELFHQKTEQIANIKSDIYSMGLIFYQILTMKQYYEGSSAEEILKKNIQKISLRKKQKAGFEINHMQYCLLQKMLQSNPEKRKSSYQILTSQSFRKVNKIYGLDYLSSSTGSPSKKSSSGQQETNEDGFVDSLWKMIRIRSWSN